MLKKVIQKTIRKAGYSLNRIEGDFSMIGALKRCKSREIKINTVIDVGASDGRWSKKCMNFFPDARYLMFDALNTHEDNLTKFCAINNNAEFILAAAGDREGTTYFNNSSLYGGSLSNSSKGSNIIEVPVTTIDSQINNRNLKPPFLIKLDTHGFEVPILEGAKQTLIQTNLVIIEAYHFKLTDESLRFYEICKYMENLGFSPIDMADFMLRKCDNSFWQMDMFFVPSSREEFLYRNYQ